jgi:hypothetical protein
MKGIAWIPIEFSVKFKNIVRRHPIGKNPNTIAMIPKVETERFAIRHGQQQSGP